MEEKEDENTYSVLVRTYTAKTEAGKTMIAEARRLREENSKLRELVVHQNELRNLLAERKVECTEKDILDRRDLAELIYKLRAELGF